MHDVDSHYYNNDRKKYSSAIETSRSHKKVIIAGPGTGKTFIFQSLFRKIKRTSTEEGLALTFIRNLVADLKIELAGLAKVATFHSFCKSVLQSFKNDEFEYFPMLFEVIEADFNILELDRNNNESIERCFFGLKDDKVIRSTIKIGDYYNAASHSDSAYRVIRHFESDETRIPKYPLIVVDEYQDFNFLETSLVEILSRKSPVLIVGDDDQALYAFKQASPDYIRRLAHDPKFRRFELPYCSRCTKVIVEAVNKIVSIAKDIGRLDGRVDKPFKYFPPDKKEDSKKHPEIINIHCSVERKNCHYIGKFIGKEIERIPLSYIRESADLKEPTVLVIGPKQFLEGVKQEMLLKFGRVPEKAREDRAVNLLDGYKLVAKKEMSRLGWRILLHCDPCMPVEKTVKKAISGNKDLYNLISSRKYISHHYEMAIIIKKILERIELTPGELRAIETRLGLPFEEITAMLSADPEEGYTKEQDTGRDADKPHILCTSFEGAKGLAAQYVFIVGLNENHFPRKTPPSNRDIYRLIVAITRTRKKCFMISCGNFAGEILRPSIFKSWLKDELSREMYIDKSFISKYCC